MQVATVNTLLPEVTFTTTEMTELALALSKPVVKKYLLSEARKSVMAIATGGPKPDESAESYLRRQQAVAGGLAVIEGLLQIVEPPKA